MLNVAKGAAPREEEDMKHLLTFLRDQERMYEGTEEERKQSMEAWNAFNREAIEAGVMIANEALELPSTAKTLRFEEDGSRPVTDGPFAETKEQLGGFCLIDCASLDEALEWARKVPLNPGSKLEVRQVKDLTPYGYENVGSVRIESTA
jgi:hypothetical protein